MLDDILIGISSNFIYDILKKEFLDFSKSSRIQEIIEATKVHIGYKTNYLDYATNLVNKDDLFFDLEITNKANLHQQFLVDVYCEKLEKGILNPFLCSNSGQNIKFSQFGNMFNVAPNNSQTIKIFNQQTTESILKLNGSLDQKKLNFDLKDQEFKFFYKINNHTKQKTLFLSQYNPSIPENKPFSGVGLAIRIYFVLGEWQISRFYNGGLAYKEDIAKLINFYQRDYETKNFLFPFIANIIYTGITYIKNNTTNEEYLISNDTSSSSSGLNLNEKLFTTPHFPKNSSYIFVSNISSQGCITQMIFLHANSINNQINFPKDFW